MPTALRIGSTRDSPLGDGRPCNDTRNRSRSPSRENRVCDLRDCPTTNVRSSIPPEYVEDINSSGVEQRDLPTTDPPIVNLVESSKHADERNLCTRNTVDGRIKGIPIPPNGGTENGKTSNETRSLASDNCYQARNMPGRNKRI